MTDAKIFPPQLVRQYALGLGVSEPVAHGDTFRIEGTVSLEIEAARMTSLVLPQELAKIAAAVSLEIERRGQRFWVTLEPRSDGYGLAAWVPAFPHVKLRVEPGDRFHVAGVNVEPEPKRFRGSVMLDVVLTEDLKAAAAAAAAPAAPRKRGRR
jgi:hypothetical protein